MLHPKITLWLFPNGAMANLQFMDAFQVSDLNVRSQAGFYDFFIVAFVVHHEGLDRLCY
jgi:hypothetical protein